MIARTAPFLITLMLTTALSVSASQTQESSRTVYEPATFEDVKKETSELLDALKSYGANERDEAVAQTKEALAKIDRRIDSMEVEIARNWDQMSQEAREKSRQTMQELRRQRVEVAEWYGSLKRSSVAAWEQIKEGFSEAYQGFTNSWEKAETEVEPAE